MMLRIRQFLTLAGLTAAEAIRQPVCLMLTTACVLSTALVPVLLMNQLGEQGKLVRDGGLAFHFVYGLLVAAFSASASIGREVRRGTVSSILAKPVSRELFFLAKYAGLLVVLLAFSFCATTATLLAERVSEKFVQTPTFTAWVIDWQTGTLLLLTPAVSLLAAAALNWRFRRPFESSAFLLLMGLLAALMAVVGLFNRDGSFGPYQPNLLWRMLPASALIALALGTIGAVALAISTRLTVVPTITLCGGILAFGFMSDHLFGAAAVSSPVARVVYTLLPNWQHFWVVDFLRNGGTVPGLYCAQAALYGALYAGAALMAGIALFRHAQVT
jgi:ABC-type transport system involved in multi-copper enzyme maturation permease subunit